jgi:hypothetical protein
MTTITFKLSDEEARALRRNARKERLTVSEYVRRALRPGRRAGPPKLVKCAVTGAVIFAGCEGPALTTASVRDMLEDFP